MDGARFMDSETFEACLRRLNALENKLTDQVSVDIQELKKQWVQKRVDRVTTNAFKLYQVREQLKSCRMLYVEEERILTEFNRVKEMLVECSMDDEAFDATKETCIVLGQKLTGTRNRQKRLDGEIQDLETIINAEIMAIKYEEKDFAQLDLQEVRAKTPVRELSPTPLDRHRAKSRSKEPSPFRLPPLRISSGSTTPGGAKVSDPHAYFSRPDSRESTYGGRGVAKDPQLEAFRAQMEAKQAEDESPPTKRGGLSKSMSGNIVLRDASGQLIAKSDGTNALNLTQGGGEMFSHDQERPNSAMSDCSIAMSDGMEFSRPGSGLSGRFESDIGDAMLLGKDAELEAFRTNFEAKQAEVNGHLEELQSEEEEAAQQQKLEEEEKEAARLQEVADERRRQFEEKRQLEEEEKRQEAIKLKAEEEQKRIDYEAKLKAQKEAEKAERLAKIQKQKEEAEKKRLADEKAKEEMAKRAADLQARKDRQAQEIKEEKQKKLEEKKAKIKEAEDKKKAEEEKAKAFEEKKAAAAEKKQLAVKKKKKKEEATEAEKIQLAVEEGLKDEQVLEHTKLDEFEQKLAELDGAEFIEDDMKNKNIMEKAALAEQKEEELQIKIDDVKEKIRKRSLSRGRSGRGSRDASRDRASRRRSGEFSASEDEGTNTETLDTKKKSLQKDVEDLESSLTSAKSEAVESEPEQPKPKTPVDETKEEKPKPKGRPASRSNSKKLLDVEKCESSAEEAEISAHRTTDESESYAPKTTDEEMTGDSSDPFSETLADQPKIKSRSSSKSKKAPEEADTGSDKEKPTIKSRSRKSSNKIEKDESSTEETEKVEGMKLKSRSASRNKASDEIGINLEEATEGLELAKPKSRSASRGKPSEDEALQGDKEEKELLQEMESVKPKSRSQSRTEAGEALVLEAEQIEPIKIKSRSASGTRPLELKDATFEQEMDQEVPPFELEPIKPKSRSASRNQAPDIAALEQEMDQDVPPFELESVKPKSRSASRNQAPEIADIDQEMDQDVPPFELEPVNAKSRSTSRGRPSEDVVVQSKMEDEETIAMAESKPGIMQRGRPTEKAVVPDAASKVVDQTRSAKKRSTSRGMSEIKPSDVIAAKEAIDGVPLSKRDGSSGAHSRENVDSLKPSSKQGSRGGSRPESPVSILKKPGQSRSASRDRAGKVEVGALDEKLPLSRSSSFRAKFGEKKKISFDDDVDPSTVVPQPGADVLAAIADTSLQSGLKQRSRDASRERPAITLTFETDPVSEFGGPSEPADYYPPEEGYEEDELMIVFDSPDETSGLDLISPGGIKSRSTSRESASRNRGIASKSADSSEKANESSSSSHKQHLQQRKPDFNEYSEAEPPSLEGVDQQIGRIRTTSQTSRSSFGLQGKKSRSGSGVPELEIISGRGDRPLSDVLDSDVGEGLQAAILGVRRPSSRGPPSPYEDDFGRQEELSYDKNSLANVGSDVPFGSSAQEDLYATVKPKNQRKMYEEPEDSLSSAYTEEGFVINKENELGNIDHTSLKYQDYLYGEGPQLFDDEVTEYDVDELTGRRTKKVSFAEEDERHEFERQAKAKGLGKLFSFPQKPMISLPGIEKKKVEVIKPAEATFPESILASTSLQHPPPDFLDSQIPPKQEPPQSFISAMTGGLIRGKSPTPGREGLFGSLLRRKGSKTSSRNSSLDRNEEVQGRIRGVLKQSSQQSGSITSSRRSSADGSGSYFSDFENLNADKTTLQADIQDLNEELSFAKRLGRKMRRKPVKVTKTDFDELFAGGMAKSAVYETQTTNLDPFANQNIGANGSNNVPTYDEHGTRFTPFEVYSQEDGFKKSQEAEGIGYAEKVESYLYEQAHLGTKSNLAAGDAQQPERSRQRRRDGKEPVPGRPTSLKRKEKGTKGPPPAPQANEAEFLKKATQFVASNEVDSQYTQPVWPATAPSQDMMPSLRQSGPDALKTLEQYSPSGPSPTRLAPSPGKSFLDSKSGAELFRTSIDQTEIPSTIPTINEPRNMDATGIPSTLSVAPIPPSRSPKRSCSPNVHVTVSSPPRTHEPGDKGLPNQLKPDILMANEEFYEKLRTGLQNFGSTQSGLNQETVKAMAGIGNAEFYQKLTSGLKTFSQATADPMFGQLKDKVAPGMGHEEFYNKLSSGLSSITASIISDPVLGQKEDQPDFTKYSHHLGRAEFGTLRKTTSRMGSAAVSRDTSGDRVKGSLDTSRDRLRLSRNASADKINMMAKLNRKESNASATSGMESFLQRSDSRMSDYSGMLPDLEMDDVGEFVSEEELRMVHKTQSLIVDQKISQMPAVIDPNSGVLQKKQEVLLELDRHRQEIREKKAWIQNGLMSALGFCVVVYLQTLEAAGVGQ